MCLILFAHRVRADLPLVLAANRDEFFARPTQSAGFWQPVAAGPWILSGRDLSAGGTWLGVAEDGRWAGITNIRNPADSRRAPRSRGELPVAFLTGGQSAEVFLTGLATRSGDYAGFNLLLGDGDAVWYLNSDHPEPRALDPGVYGLSNGRLDDPWPKVVRGRRWLTDLLNAPAPVTTDALLLPLQNRSIAPDGELPVTGVSLELERQLSASFILNPDRNYGTRCSSVLVREAAGRVRFCEQTYNGAGDVADRRIFHLELMGSE